eukprot:gnl/TRDRNA2_/TRDRNA2_189616_c0_seq1.p1 gnl/TRDRNA2_/TRDRNA2_189616_c0~~gnl/TRDRNA2_/TRDRNA2_189616_c0_seq1.p1  ORF type:complete len:278 (-),score=31.87 gnl/TRDRNA2_/TRDRNA2_189616_c0_seq1:467-1300(-)
MHDTGMDDTVDADSRQVAPGSADDMHGATSAEPAEDPNMRTKPGSDQPVLRVVIGTSKMSREDPKLAANIADAAYRANGHQRFSVREVEGRLAKGDAEPNANRVLHVAFLGDQVAGCCSSTVQTGWTSSGCGHMGALAVDPNFQGRGVASALVDAAEERLLKQGCARVQIEYHYYQGEAESERLRAWYEDRLGYSGSGAGWRCATKRLSAKAIEDRRRKRASKQLTSTDVSVSPSQNGSSCITTTDSCDDNHRSSVSSVVEGQLKDKPPSCSRCSIL